MKKIRLFVLFLMIAVLIISCATNISSIKKAPRKYVNKPVTIRGTIIKINPVPLTSIKILEIYDNTDTIFVLTKKEVEKNKVKFFKGEIVPIGGQLTKERANILQRKIAEFLIANELVTPQDARLYSRKMMEFLSRIAPRREFTLLMLEKNNKKRRF